MAAIKSAAKPLEIKKAEGPSEWKEGAEKAGVTGSSKPLFQGIFGDRPGEIDAPVDNDVALFSDAYHDTDPMPSGPHDTDLAPQGSIRYFADFSRIGDQLVEAVTRTSAEELYASIEAGALRALARSVPSFGAFGRLIEAGFDVFGDLKVPNSMRLFRLGEDTAVFGKGSWAGHDRIQSAVMSPQHVKITQSGKGLKIEDVSGQTKFPLWVGEKSPGTGRTEWRRLAPGEAYETHGEGLVEIAVGPIVNEMGEPTNFTGAMHLGINNQMDVPRIFHME